MPPNNDGALICCRPGCSADVPAIRKWSLPVCQACLPKEKVRLRSLKRREKDRGEDFKDPEHRWYGQPGKFPKPPLYHINGHLYTDRNWQHLRSSIFKPLQVLEADILVKLGIPKISALSNSLPIVQLIKIQLCKNPSCHQPLPFSDTPAFCIHCETRSCKRKRTDSSPDDPRQPPAKMARSPPISAEELFEACEDGDLPLVRRLLKKVRPGDGILENVDWPSLIIASRTGHAEIVKALIKAGASLDLVADSDYWDYELTSLGAACYNGHLDIVETLLDANADSSIDDGSALVAACIRGNTEIVKILLKRGIDCNIRDGFSLCVACEESYLSIIELLLEHGAEINQAGNWHPLPCAARSGNLTTVTMLLDKGADIGAVDRDHGPALHAACRGKNEEIVAKLLAHGADVHQTDTNGQSALHIAAADSTVQIIRRLLEHGANINAIDENDDTPLIDACLFSDNPFAKVELLLQRGADVDACGRFGTALTVSCWRGDADVCKLLLQLKADVTIEGGEFGTALHAACHKEHYELLPPLLEKGADPYSEVGFYGSAITIARHKNRPDIVDLLQRLSKHPHPRHMNSYDLLPSFHTAFPHPVDRSLPYRPATCLQISLDLQSDVL